MEPASYLYVTPYGLTSVTALGATTIGAGWRRSIEVERFSYWWFPQNYLRPYLYPGFSLEFECTRAADGTRQFIPVGGYKAFIQRAFLAGLATLYHEGEISFRDWKSYVNQHLVFQLVGRMQQHIKRRFDSSRDLTVPAKGRGGDVGRSVLPEELRIDGSRPGPISIDVLMRHGRESAMAAGIVNPTEKQMIHFGLFEAARHNPLCVPLKDTSALFRLALFDLEQVNKPSRDEIERVQNRIFRWIDDHGEDSTEQFNLVFFPGKGNLVKAIADQPKSPGGKLDHGLVRRAILEIGWDSYQIVGRCIEAFMGRFLNCLPGPVRHAERRLIHEMYFRRPHYANLPLVLFLERGSFIQEAVIKLWDHPGDAALIGTLHRLLDIFGQLIAKRRTADRRAKQKANGASPGVEVRVDDLDAFESAPPQGATVYEEIAEYLAERDDLHCSRCKLYWNSRLADDRPDGALPDPIELKISCGCEQVSKDYRFSLEEFKNLAARFMEDLD